MRKPTLVALPVRIVVSLAVAVTAAVGVAAAAQPKRNGVYADKKHNVTMFMQGTKSMYAFDAGCTAAKHPRFSFSYIWGISVDKHGKFHADHKNAVNTPNGGTLLKTSRVTISGQFVSSKEAKGTYQLHKGNCPKIKFDAKLS